MHIYIIYLRLYFNMTFIGLLVLLLACLYVCMRRHLHCRCVFTLQLCLNCFTYIPDIGHVVCGRWGEGIVCLWWWWWLVLYWCILNTWVSFYYKIKYGMCESANVSVTCNVYYLDYKYEIVPMYLNIILSFQCVILPLFRLLNCTDCTVLYVSCVKQMLIN
jgi:hypothetical protein